MSTVQALMVLRLELNALLHGVPYEVGVLVCAPTQHCGSHPVPTVPDTTPEVAEGALELPGIAPGGYG